MNELTNLILELKWLIIIYFGTQAAMIIAAMLICLYLGLYFIYRWFEKKNGAD